MVQQLRDLYKRQYFTCSTVKDVVVVQILMRTMRSECEEFEREEICVLIGMLEKSFRLNFR